MAGSTTDMKEEKNLTISKESPKQKSLFYLEETKVETSTANIRGNLRNAASFNTDHTINNTNSTTGMKRNKNAYLRKSKSFIEFERKRENQNEIPHSQSFCEKSKSTPTSSHWSIPEHDANQTFFSETKMVKNVSSAKNSNEDIFTQQQNAMILAVTSEDIAITPDDCITTTIATQLHNSITTTSITVRNPADCITTPAITESKLADCITTPSSIGYKTADCITLAATTQSKPTDCNIISVSTVYKTADCITTTASKRYKPAGNTTTPVTTGYKLTGCSTIPVTAVYNLAGCITTLATTEYNLTSCITPPATTGYNLAGCITTPATTEYNLAGCMTTPATTGYKLTGCITTPATAGQPPNCITTPAGSKPSKPTTTGFKPADCINTSTCTELTTSTTVVKPPEVITYSMTKEITSCNVTSIFTAKATAETIVETQKQVTMKRNLGTSNDEIYDQNSNIPITSQNHKLKQHAKLQIEINSFQDQQTSKSETICNSPFSPKSRCDYLGNVQKRWKNSHIEQFHGDTLSSCDEQDDDDHDISCDGNKSYLTDSKSVTKVTSTCPVTHNNQPHKAFSSRQTPMSTFTVLTTSSQTSTITSSTQKPPLPSSSPSSSNIPVTHVTSPSVSTSSSLFKPLSAAVTSTTKSTTEGAEAFLVSVKDAPCRREQHSPCYILGSSERPLYREQSLEADCLPLGARKSSISPLLSSTESSAQISMSSTDSRQSSIPIAKVAPTCRSDSQSNMEGKRDFVLLHAEADTEEAQKCRDHLEADIGSDRGIPIIPNFTVDLFSEIDGGRTAMRSLEQLHDKYIYILVLGTRNLADDHFSIFLNENILTKGLKEANGKENRVLPIWVTNDCINLILELSIIRGFRYYDFLTDRCSVAAKQYIKYVRNTVTEGREKFK